MMAYISASPFLYQDLMGMRTLQYGLAFGLNALVLAVVGGVSVKLTYRFSIRSLTRTGLGINLAPVVALFLFVLFDAPVLLLTVPIRGSAPGIVAATGPPTPCRCSRNASASFASLPARWTEPRWRCSDAPTRRGCPASGRAPSFQRLVRSS